MKSYLIILILAIISFNLYGQTQEQKDSLISLICKEIVEAKGKPDTVRIMTAFEKHLFPFLLKFSQEKVEEIVQSIDIRLQRSCPEYRKILDVLNPPKGDWQELTEKPASKLNKKLCKQFLKHKKYSYIEANGDTTQVEIDKNYWIDRFKDGTYSKLSFKWVNDCEFEIEFIESNNTIRKNFSKPGDKYRYQILDKKEGYYDVSVEIIGTTNHLAFKIYY